MGEVFNIGSDEEISMEALADKIIEIAGSKSKKEFVPYEIAYGRPIEDMMRRVPCLERIKKEINWQPRTGLKETLSKVIDNFKKQTD